MLYAFAFALALSLSAQEMPADPEAEALAELHVRAAKRCESDPRADGETIEACASRRARALLDTYGSTAGALGATARWTDGPSTGTGALGFQTLSEGLALPSAAPARPLAQPYQPPPPRCRRETTRSEDGNSVSSSIVCGNNPDAQNAAREMLDRLSQPQN